VRRAWFVLALMALALVGCGDEAPYRGAGGLPPGAKAVQGATDGRTLYARDCAWCHGADGSGTKWGPSLAGSGAAGADFYLSTGRMPLRDPDAKVRSSKPAYSQSEIRAITEYAASLGSGPAIPELGRSSGVGRGAILYEDNCAACHSSAGVGAALTSGVEAPSLLEDTKVQIAEAIRIGPGTMPVFDRGTLSDEDVAAIVEYVAALQEPQQQGGLSLGRIGPIAEGAVGWVVGLGILLIVVQAIGTRGQR
jgi:ubiquinol-cytochrome c reductase cytochrome c subunit